MEALKWLGYTLAAIAVLSVITGIGLLIVTAVVIGGATVFVVCVVAYVAALIKGSVESSRPDK